MHGLFPCFLRLAFRNHARPAAAGEYSTIYEGPQCLWHTFQAKPNEFLPDAEIACLHVHDIAATAKAFNAFLDEAAPNLMQLVDIFISEENGHDVLNLVYPALQTAQALYRVDGFTAREPPGTVALRNIVADVATALNFVHGRSLVFGQICAGLIFIDTIPRPGKRDPRRGDREVTAFLSHEVCETVTGLASCSPGIFPMAPSLRYSAFAVAPLTILLTPTFECSLWCSPRG